MYGNGCDPGDDRRRATARSAATTFPQLIDLTVTTASPHQLSLPTRRLRADDHGAVEPTTHPGYGQSTRIVGGNLSARRARSRSWPFPTARSRTAVRHVHHQRRAVQRHGLRLQPGDTASWTTVRHASASPHAVRAARRARSRCCRTCRFPLTTPFNSYNPPGGANSDYTAADFQHMLLAAQVAKRRTRRAESRRSPRCTGRRFAAIGPTDRTSPPPDFTNAGGLATAAAES